LNRFLHPVGFATIIWLLYRRRLLGFLWLVSVSSRPLHVYMQHHPLLEAAARDAPLADPGLGLAGTFSVACQYYPELVVIIDAAERCAAHEDHATRRYVLRRGQRHAEKPFTIDERAGAICDGPIWVARIDPARPPRPNWPDVSIGDSVCWVSALQIPRVRRDPAPVNLLTGTICEDIAADAAARARIWSNTINTTLSDA